MTATHFPGKAGKQVLVLEKERLPRYKTCGGGLSVRFLNHTFPFPFKELIQSHVTRFSYANKEGWMTIPVE